MSQPTFPQDCPLTGSLTKVFLENVACIRNLKCSVTQGFHRLYHYNKKKINSQKGVLMTEILQLNQSNKKKIKHRQQRSPQVV